MRTDIMESKDLYDFRSMGQTRVKQMKNKLIAAERVLNNAIVGDDYNGWIKAIRDYTRIGMEIENTIRLVGKCERELIGRGESVNRTDFSYVGWNECGWTI